MLDVELDDVLIIFDETILEARRKALEDPSAPGSEPSEDVDISDEEDGGGGADGQPSVAVVEGGEEEPAEGGQESSGEQGEEGEESDTDTGEEGMPTGTSPTEGDPDGQDDDIVARQLTELAMAEKDPVLREKYWEEYRRYKEGTN